jgi:hypothetical protein
MRYLTRYAMNLTGTMALQVAGYAMTVELLCLSWMGVTRRFNLSIAPGYLRYAKIVPLDRSMGRISLAAALREESMFFPGAVSA